MIYIGIDPGVHTGIAVWNSAKREFVCVTTTRILNAIDIVKRYWVLLQHPEKEVQVIFEDARQRRWYTGDVNAKAQGAGSIKRDCAIWEEFLKDYGIPFQAVPPSGGMTKWDESYFKAATGWTGRTSSHARDAAVLVFGR
jgi:hypothetical protein